MRIEQLTKIIEHQVGILEHCVSLRLKDKGVRDGQNNWKREIQNHSDDRRLWEKPEKKKK